MATNEELEIRLKKVEKWINTTPHWKKESNPLDNITLE
jgi:hypothetical protein